MLKLQLMSLGSGVLTRLYLRPVGKGHPAPPAGRMIDWSLKRWLTLHFTFCKAPSTPWSQRRVALSWTRKGCTECKDVCLRPDTTSIVYGMQNRAVQGNFLIAVRSFGYDRQIWNLYDCRHAWLRLHVQAHLTWIEWVDCLETRTPTGPTAKARSLPWRPWFSLSLATWHRGTKLQTSSKRGECKNDKNVSNLEATTMILGCRWRLVRSRLQSGNSQWRKQEALSLESPRWSFTGELKRQGHSWFRHSTQRIA